MTRIAGVILAGGRGERLGGVIKANLAIDGRRLLDRVTERLQDVDTLLVAHGPIPPDALGLASHHLGISDLVTDYAGPLAGLAAAVNWANQQAVPPEILVLAPVDTPFLPENYLARLIAGLANAPAAIASFNGQPYPTNSAWRRNVLLDLPTALRAGSSPHSLKRLGAALGAIQVDFPANAGGDPFANANTPDDLVALERRASLAAGFQQPGP
ncbi:molybdenum cofactor guanylyltransferase [Devosia sp.]|jgi:molybdopterin-guanine dinucleotide biosynthesis protein A|uniref:molybdenum cofactor guanylyltransferase n=1 Tax=Devosia sp. TaxID=1871048 RepID=UPI0037C0BB4A